VRELQRLADFPTLSEDGFVEFHAYVRGLVARNEGWENIVVTAPDGRLILDTALPMPPGRSLPFVDQPHVAQAVRTGRPVVSDVYQSARTGESAIGVSVPVIRDDEVKWVLSARLDPAVLSQFVGSQLYRDGALASVVDRNSRLVARSRDADRFFGSEVTADLRAALSRGAESGTERLTTLDGVTMLAAWHRLPSAGWTVTIGVPVDVFDVPLRRSLGGLLLFGLAVLLVGISLSLMLGRRVSAAIDAVAHDARDLAAGVPLVSRHSSIRQVDTLFVSLREASAVQRDKEQAREHAVDALREADRRKDEFLAMLAHELRNPLAPLRTAMGVLARTPRPDPDETRLVGMCERQVRQLTRLVDDLLDVSRITHGKIALQRAPLAVSELVAEAVEAIRPTIEQRGQRLSLRLPDGSPVVDGDGLRLAQVVENLLSNASKYTDAGGVIDVEVEDAVGSVVVRVRDSGIGLQPEQLCTVFELFTQVDASRERAQGGLGIGLSLVKRLVELHGGTVSAHSDGPGRGACFEVRLPRDRAPVAA